MMLKKSTLFRLFICVTNSDESVHLLPASVMNSAVHIPIFQLEKKDEFKTGYVDSIEIKMVIGDLC